MVKRREPKISPLAAERKEPTAAEVEAFANKADGVSTEIVLDKNAPRKFKTMTLPFNEYEYEELLKGVNLSDRTKLNFVRYAMLKLAKELQEEA
jgi:hypothetical protein